MPSAKANESACFPSSREWAAMALIPRNLSLPR
jgi:hypothetical protein